MAGVALICTKWRVWSALVARGAAPLCVAGVALGDIHLHFTWQALRLETSTCVWRGKRGTCCTWWRAWSPLVARGAAPLCVAGVALGDIHLRFTWQAWHLVTSAFVSRGKRGTYGLGLALAGRLDPPSLSHHLSHTTLSHTICDTPLCHTPSLTHHLSHAQLCQSPSLTHNLNLVTHHLSHTSLSTTIFHTHLCQPPSFTHHLSHTTLSHTIFHTPLCHTPSFTHHFVTHHLCHPPSFRHHLSHTHTQLCHTPSFTHRHRPSFTHHPLHTALSPTIFHT